MSDEFSWVRRRHQCSIEHIFQVIVEQVDTDVKTANELRGEEVFRVNRLERKLMVANVKRPGDAVVLERFSYGIDVRRGQHKPLFRARPHLDEKGECLVEVEGGLHPLTPWQVSRRALEDLFFEAD